MNQPIDQFVDRIAWQCAVDVYSLVPLRTVQLGLFHVLLVGRGEDLVLGEVGKLPASGVGQVKHIVPEAIQTWIFKSDTIDSL